MLFVMAEPPPSRVQDFAEAQRLAGELSEAVALRLQADLRCAAVLAEIEVRDATRWLGCASVGEVGERAGVSAEEARGLCDLGKALPRDPLLERKVREGHIPVRAACIVSRVLANPALLRAGDAWLDWAEREPVKALQRRVRERVEQARAEGEPIVPITVFVRQRTRGQFERAREVASGRAMRALTNGETFETVVDHYLDSFDIDRVEPGKRRVGPTTHIDGRYIPVEVRRAIYERQGHACAIPLCGHTLFLEHAHIHAHARGGSREADNLILLCSFHHDMFDSSGILFTGTAAQPVFLDRQGRDLAGRWGQGGVLREALARGASPAAREGPDDAAGGRASAVEGPQEPPWPDPGSVPRSVTTPGAPDRGPPPTGEASAAPHRQPPPRGGRGAPVAPISERDPDAAGDATPDAAADTLPGTS
jgi:hypothetical protein